MPNLLDTLFGSLQSYASSSSNKTALWLGLLLLFFIVYFIVIWFSDIRKSTAIVIAFFPVLLLDAVISFGIYTFKFPLGFSYTTQKFYITLSIFDYVFNFGLFKNYGLAVFDHVNGLYLLSGTQNILTFLFVFSDSLIEFVLIAYVLYYLIGRIDFALLGASIPTLVYTWRISNPLTEFVTAKATVSHVFYFLSRAAPEQKLLVIGLFLLSFAFIVFIIATVSGFFMTVGKTTVRPGLEASSWEFSMTGVALGWTLAYAVVQLLHPEYSWYAVLPVLIIYNIFRSRMKGMAERRKAEKAQRQMFREVMEEREGY
jgi:hypothetical protein